LIDLAGILKGYLNEEEMAWVHISFNKKESRDAE
jgi:hypothetical protein